MWGIRGAQGRAGTITARHAAVGASTAGSYLNVDISIMIDNVTFKLLLCWVGYLAEGALVHLGAVMLHLVHLQHMAVQKGFVAKFAIKWFECSMCTHVHL